VTLPPKALQALVDLKAQLLSHEAKPIEEIKVELPEPKKREKKPTTFMRHARLRGESWQRYKRQGGW
jgi:hypothetical protein